MSIETTFTEPKRTRSRLALSFGLAMMATLFLFGLLAADPAHSKTFIVNSTGDGAEANPGDGTCQTATAGECTLRAAIQEANFVSGADTINFAISGAEPHTISPANDLPLITTPVTIDGYTQSGAQKNTLTEPDQTNAVLAIQLSGGHAGLFLTNGASNSVIRGLVINGCLNNPCTTGISLSGGRGYRVEGNFIGTAADGITLLPNGRGVHLRDGTSGSTIGGTTPDKRNLISGNSSEGVLVEENSSGNTIVGNLIAKNRPIFGTGGIGVVLNSAGSTGNRILSNSIYDNGLLGIDLNGDGVTANEAKDPDTGPNRLQNYPLITSAQTFGSFTSISGTLDSTPSVKRKIRRNGKVRTRVVRRSFTIQFFSSPFKDPSDHGEGKTFLGQKQVRTGLQGQASFSFAPNQVVPVGRFVTATATRMTTGDTSEFSEARIVEEPVIGP